MYVIDEFRVHGWLKYVRGTVGMASDHVHDRPKHRGGRPKLWDENINLTLPKGAKARMDAALGEGEDRLNLIRVAIDAELRRREAPTAPTNASEITPKPTWTWSSYGISGSGTAIEWRLPLSIKAAASVRDVGPDLDPPVHPPAATLPEESKSRPKRKRPSSRTDDPRYNRWIRNKRQGQVAAWDDYETFLRDVGKRPDGLVYLRRDPNAPHGPENFHWGAVGERNYASGRCNKVLHDGRMWSIAELSEKYNIKEKTLRARLRKLPLDEALNQEVRWGPGHPKYT